VNCTGVSQAPFLKWWRFSVPISEDPISPSQESRKVRRADSFDRDSLGVAVIQEVTRQGWVRSLNRRGISLGFQVNPEFFDQRSMGR